MRETATTGVDGGCIDMLDTMKNQRIDIPEVIEKFGVPPEKVGDVLALMGDPVDNVPGIFGIGPKTATKLIQDYGDLESALARRRRHETLQAARPADRGSRDGRLSRGAGRAASRTASCRMALDDFKLGEIPKEPLAAFLTKHGFTSLLKRLGDGKGSPSARPRSTRPSRTPSGVAAAPEGNRQPLPEMPRARPFCLCLRAIGERARGLDRAAPSPRGVVAIDTETSSLDSMQAELVGVSLALGPEPGLLHPARPWRHRPVRREAGTGPARRPRWRCCKPLLESDAVLKIGHNIKYDLNDPRPRTASQSRRSTIRWS